MKRRKENEQDLISCQLEPKSFRPPRPPFFLPHDETMRRDATSFPLLFVVLLKALKLAPQLIVATISSFFSTCATTRHPDQVRVPAVVTVDPADESAGQKDHPQDHHAEQSHEGAGAEGALVQVAARQRARHRRRLPAPRRPINRLTNRHRTISVSNFVGCCRLE